VVNRLIERLDWIKIDPKVILDVGVGTGYCARALRQRYKKASVIGLDMAPSMLAKARSQASRMDRWRGKQRFVCADAHNIPLADNSVDMVFSSLAIQWCNDLDQVFKEFRRVLKPEGLLMFATLGPDTLRELRLSWRAVDDYAHVSAFMDMHDIGDALMRTRMADPVMDVETITLTYDDVRGLVRDLKTLGSRNAAQGRQHSLTGKQRFAAMEAAYETYRRDGQLPASYEVAYGHAWVPLKKDDDEQQHPAHDFPIPVRQLR
jgi:malonyl-CoA O-methyltransferase